MVGGRGSRWGGYLYWEEVQSGDFKRKNCEKYSLFIHTFYINKTFYKTADRNPPASIGICKCVDIFMIKDSEKSAFTRIGEKAEI